MEVTISETVGNREPKKINSSPILSVIDIIKGDLLENVENTNKTNKSLKRCEEICEQFIDNFVNELFGIK